MASGAFKLVRVAAGLLHYGCVVVNVQQDAAPTNIRLSPSVEIFGNNFKLTANQAPEWVKGAHQGCRDAVEFARRQGIADSCVVEILCLDGSYVDTTEESMRITAFMAVWDALTLGKQPLTLSFEDGRWKATSA